MPRVRDWLDRFRPAGGPGALSGAGVPTDRRQAAATELEPVFAAMADVVRAADAERRRAAGEAQRVLAEAERRADSIRAEAAKRAEAVRAAEEVRIRDEALAQAARVMRHAAAEAQAARQQAAGRRADLVAAVVSRLRADLDGAVRTPTVPTDRAGAT